MPEAGLRGHTLYSASNRRRFEHWVWTPPGQHEDLPLVVLLHGVDDAGGFVWWQNARVHELAARLVAAGELPPFCLLLPTDTGLGRGTGWCDWADGSTLAETYLIDELLPWSAGTLPVGEAVHVGGLSMGGYGALMLALRHPGSFRSATSTSGFFAPTRLFTFVPDAASRMWGDPERQAEHDAWSLVTEPRRRAGLRIALDCGDADHLVEENRAFAGFLRTRGIAHGYVELPGAHTWDYWTARVEHHLRFHLGRGGDLSAAYGSATAPPAPASPPASTSTATA